MPINKLLQRLKLASQNPDLGIAFSNEEILQVAMALLSSIESTNKAIEAGKVKGIDGVSPKSGVDFMSKSEQETLIKTTLDSFTGNLDNNIKEKLESLTSGKDGADAIVSEELIGKIAGMAAGLIEIPDVTQAAETAITASPESIRDALELLSGDDKLSFESVRGLEDKLVEFQTAILTQTSKPAGGVSVNKVLSLIEENTGGTFLALEDTFSSYSGKGTEVLRVNAAEDAIETVTLAGGGDALTTDPLSQFAATTSLQLKGVISDETGSGALVFGTSPSITTPTGIVTNDITESTDKNYVSDAESASIGTALQNVIEDTTPQLGGDLDANSKNIINIPRLDFDTALSAPAHQEGRMFYDTDTKTFGLYIDEADVTLSIGEEEWLRINNTTGSTLTDGTVVYVDGASGGFPTVAKGDASLAVSSDTVIGVVTHDIENATEGIVTTFGLVRGLNTSSFSAGDPLYLSATAGTFISTPPTFPDYTIRVGSVVTSGISDGVIMVNAVGSALDIIHNFNNGSLLHTVDLSVTSNGTTITASIERDGGGDITAIFSNGFHEIDTTPAATVSLTAGTDTVPVENFLYIPESTDTLTVSTSGFPAGEYAPIGRVVCQSAATLQTDGALKVHAWTDHLASSTNNGHMAHINSWIRNQGATWVSGVAQTFTPTVGGGTDTVIDVATTSGVVLQLHNHSFPAFDTSVSDEIYIVNEPTTPYTKMAGLVRATLTQDSTATSLSNRSYPLFIYGIVSEDEADCKLFCNLPSGSYGTDAGAIQDADRYVNTSFPTEYVGTAFPIAIITLKDRNSGSSLEVLAVEDVTSTGVAGGGGGGVASTEFSDAVFTVFNNADNTKEIELDASAITTANTRTITMADTDIDLANVPTSGEKTVLGNTSGTNTGDATFGIANTNAVDIDSTTVANGEMARFTANGLESRSDAEMKTQLGYLTDTIDDTTPELGGELDAGAHSIGFTMQTATGDGTTTIDWKLGNHMDFTFGAFNETFTFTAPSNPGVYTLSLKQDSTGSRTATWPATVKWAGGGTAPTLTTTATTGYDICSFRFDGTNYYAVPSLDFS